MSDPGDKYSVARWGRIERPHPWASAFPRDRVSVADVRAGFGRWREWPLSALPPREVTRESAVVVVMYDDTDGQCRVVMIERGHHIGSHRGELAFPGGVAHVGERPIDTALREAHEELGLDAQGLDVLGTMVQHTTYNGYRMEIIAAVAPQRPALVANQDEVARLLEIRLVDLLDPSVFWFEEWAEERHEIPFFRLGDDIAFGVTAAVLMLLLDAATKGSEAGSATS